MTFDGLVEHKDCDAQPAKQADDFIKESAVRFAHASFGKASAILLHMSLEESKGLNVHPVTTTR